QGRGAHAQGDAADHRRRHRDPDARGREQHARLRQPGERHSSDQHPGRQDHRPGQGRPDRRRGRHLPEPGVRERRQDSGARQHPAARLPVPAQGHAEREQRAAALHYAAHRQVLRVTRAMWLRNLSRDANSRGGALSLGAVVAVAAALAMAGCSADYVENNEAPVLLLITALNGGAQLDSDVRNGENSTFVWDNEVDVELTVQNKNPNAPSAPASTVQLDSYEVRYTRSDGRGTEGVDVPYRITGTLAASVGVGDELTIP